MLEMKTVDEIEDRSPQSTTVEPALPGLTKPRIEGFLRVTTRRVPIAKPGRKRTMVDPTTCQMEYSPDDIEFMLAMDQYKRDNRRPFPTWSEALEVLRSLGWKKGVSNANA